MMINTLNQFEHSLIEQFCSHPLFNHLTAITWPDLLQILIQRRFLSLVIINTYELVIDALTEEDIKKTVRNILKEEFPRNTTGEPRPSHRELLFQDLLNLGATHDMILMTPETPTTEQVRKDSYQCLLNCLREPYGQVGLVTFLRFWAEVLVSVEYACLWPRLSERLSNSNSPDKIRSEFYYFHMIHDHRKSDIGQESMLGGLTHSQELALHLKRLITSEEILLYCLNLEQKAYQLKTQFYNQFIQIPFS